MAHTDFPGKAQRRELRRLAALAYDRELAKELEAVEVQFRQWRAGNLDVHQLSDLIHQFHDGVARDLFVMYTGGQLGSVVAQAVARNALHENELPLDLRELLREQIAFYKGSGSPDDPTVATPGGSEAI